VFEVSASFAAQVNLLKFLNSVTAAPVEGLLKAIKYNVGE